MKVGEPSLDQLRIFLAVAEEGSFGGAARRMGRAISAISYGIAQLEAQLAVTLFEREGSRRPVLTSAGAGLLPEARAVANEVDALLAKTRSMHVGLESEITLVLDVMMPGDVTARVLRDFRAAFPTVALRLRVEGLGAVVECLHDEDGQLAIGGPVIAGDPGLEQRAVGSVQLIPVAAPDHPLAASSPAAKPAPGDSRKHLQLVLSDRSPRTQGHEFSVFASQTWRLGDLGAKHSLLIEGLGWGNMPRHMVVDDIVAGRLIELDLPEKPGALYTLRALWRRDSRPGPATEWLIEAFRDTLFDERQGRAVEPISSSRY